MRRLTTLAATALLLAGCLGPGGPTASPAPTSAPEPSDPPRAIRYVSLGDTFPIGDGLSHQVDRWPNQLVRLLRTDLPLELVDNLASQSVTTYDVIDTQLPVLEELAPDLVTLQVGVNDVVVSDLGEEDYRAALETILHGREGTPSTARAGLLQLLPPDRVVLVTSPDYTLLPGFHPVRPDAAARIDRFNAILAEVGAEHGVAVVDISPIADLMARDETLITDDGLHPSAKQYAGWVELIAPVVRGLFAPAPAPSSSATPSGAGVG